MIYKVITHSSGLPILFRGTGYVAGTLGAPAAVVSALPWVIGGALIVGYLIYKGTE